MTLHDVTDRMGNDDWVLVGYLLACALFYLWERSSTQPANPQPRGQDVTLHEDALQRIENGKTVVVRRWHGADLELRGGNVIDVDAEEVDAE